MAIGKISGQLLKDNLERDGVDLAFETNLLYLDVNNQRIGVKTNSPTHPLQVNGTLRTLNVEVDNTVTVGTFTLSGNTIASSSDSIYFNAVGSGAAVYNSRVLIDEFELKDNIVQITTTNQDLELQPNGTGQVKIFGNTEVYGNLHATGTITADGNLQLGDANTDNITFNADINSNIIPDLDNTYNLGSAAKRWSNVWVENLNAATVSANGIFVDGVDVTTVQGNIWYVSALGDDGKSGQHQNDTFATIEKALSVATAGDTVFIYPGVYYELFPLTVPVGVTVKGAGIRSVNIRPDTASTNEDVFLLNGECTIEDLTISNFEFDSMNNTGYAFKFAPGFTVTSRSPYIRNITVITAGSTVRLMTNPADDPRGFLAGDAGRGAYLDGSVATALSREAGCLFHSVTFITPGVDAVVMTNGVRVEWLNCFTYFANRGLYAFSGTAGFANDGKTKLKIPNRSGTWNVGNTIRYYDTDGTTILASGVIESISGDTFTIDGRQLGFETVTDRPGKSVYFSGNAQLSNVQKKFGLTSLLLDGNGDYITSPSHPDFAFGTGDFSIELWYYPNNFSNFRVLYDQRTSAPDNAAYIDVTPAGAVRYIVASSVITSTATLTLSAWNHIAVSRVSGTTRLFINGVLQASTLADSTNYAERGIRIGGDYPGNAAYWVNGYIDEVRVCKGTGKYTTTFVPSTTAFTGDLSTVLLLHFDGGSGSTTFLDDGVTLQDLRTTAGGTATAITFADYSDFGAEVRSIASANIYGNYGTYVDGVGTLMYLISQNFAYIGVGRLVTNDPTDVIQENEVVELNDGVIYYTSVDHKGDFRVGDLFLVNQQDGTITFNSNQTTFGGNAPIIITDGTNTTTINSTEVSTGNIRISGNSIQSTTGPINFSAANSQINLTSNITITGNETVVGNFAVDGNVTLGNSSSDTLTISGGIASDLVPFSNSTYDLGKTTNQWANIFTNRAVIDDIEIFDNVIRTTVSNSDLELRANGTGGILVEDLLINQNTISAQGTNQDIQFTPSGNGLVKINSTKSLQIPVGTTLQRPTPVAGMIRLNTTDNRFEGYIGTNWVPLGGISDLDGNTYIVPETTPGANDNVINFVVNGVTSATLDSTTFTVNRALVDDLEITGNAITVIPSNTDLLLSANGTGGVVIDNLRIYGNTIENIATNGVTEIVTYNDGYVKFPGNKGFVIPSGPSSARPSFAGSYVGMIRWNTDTQTTELWDGSQWTSIAGALSGINTITAEEIAIANVLILG